MSRPVITLFMVGCILLTILEVRNICYLGEVRLLLYNFRLEIFKGNSIVCAVLIVPYS